MVDTTPKLIYIQSFDNNIDFFKLEGDFLCRFSLKDFLKYVD